MKKIVQVINRSVVQPFYRQHAGLFLFLFFLMFGIQPTAQEAFRTHYYLMHLILTSGNFFLLAIIIWLIYTIKILLFSRNCLQKEAYDFIYQLNALPAQSRFLILLRSAILLMAPVTCYGLATIYVAIREQLVLAEIFVLLAIVLLHLFLILNTMQLLNGGKAIQEVKKTSPLFPLPKAFFGFVLRGIFRNQWVTVLIIKLLSFFSLYLFTNIDSPLFENRVLWLIFLTSLIGHSFLIFRNFNFIETELQFFRNMPQAQVTTFFSLFFIYTILLLPEMWALRGVSMVQDQSWEYLWLVLTGPTFLLLLHVLLYSESMKIEEYLKLLFGVWIVFFFLSFSSWHWLLPLICTLFSAAIFFTSYYQYEKKVGLAG
jgi:hypothetical protein